MPTLVLPSNFFAHGAHYHPQLNPYQLRSLACNVRSRTTRKPLFIVANLLLSVYICI